MSEPRRVLPNRYPTPLDDLADPEEWVWADPWADRHWLRDSEFNPSDPSDVEKNMNPGSAY